MYNFERRFGDFRRDGNETFHPRILGRKMPHCLGTHFEGLEMTQKVEGRVTFPPWRDRLDMILN